jgi:hypothetical protein
MWVRSQNRIQLINSNMFWIEDNNIFASVNGTQKDSVSIGKYDTEERTLKVLGMLESQLEETRKENLMCSLGAKGAYEIISWGKSVFSMPGK